MFDTNENEFLDENQLKPEITVPEPNVKGSSEISVVRHKIIFNEKDGISTGKGFIIVLRNISERFISSIQVHVAFYDSNGNVLENSILKLKDIDLNINYSFDIVSALAENNDIKSYAFKIDKVVLVPLPDVSGNDMVGILSHSLGIFTDEANTDNTHMALDMSIQNISENTLARAIFKVEFIDANGKVLSETMHEEFEINIDEYREVAVIAEGVDYNSIKSYKVNVYKTVPAEIEPIIFKSHEVKILETGNYEVSGIIKNISNNKEMCAVVTVMKDDNDEIIASRVIQISDIDPGQYKLFTIDFSSPDDRMVYSYMLRLANMVDEIVKS
jgi:hypothetical protein